MKTQVIAILACVALLSGCVTTEGPKKRDAREARESKSRSSAPKNYGLYTTRDIDQKMLKRGEQVRWSRSLDGY